MPDEDLDTQDPLKFKEEFDKAAKSSRARTNFKTCSDFCDKYIEKMTPNDSFSKNDDYDRDKLITEIYNDRSLNNTHLSFTISISLSETLKVSILIRPICDARKISFRY